MADVMVFRLKLRSPGPAAVQIDSEVVPFPYGRRRNLVERHARAMRALSIDESEAYITEVLEGICDELRAIGIDCENCENAAILDLADAVGKALHGPGFRLDLEEAAQ